MTGHKVGCVGVQRGWQEERQQMRIGGVGGGIVQSRLPLQMQMTKWRPRGSSSRSCQSVTLVRINGTHLDLLGSATAGANILVCVKAYRRDSIMPKLMSSTVFVLGVNEERGNGTIVCRLHCGACVVDYVVVWLVTLRELLCWILLQCSHNLNNLCLLIGGCVLSQLPQIDKYGGNAPVCLALWDFMQRTSLTQKRRHTLYPYLSGK